MVKKVVKKVKKVAALPAQLRKTEAKKDDKNVLFEKRTRSFGIGQDIQHKRDLTHFTKFPRYVRLQRQKAVLQKRLKVPPPINQFRLTLEKNGAAQVFSLLDKYRPETAVAKKDRLKKRAEERKEGKPETVTKRPAAGIRFGIKNVVKAVEQKKAALCVISDNCDPIEIVLYLPALCRRFEIPYVIVKGKARLGQLVHRKNAAALVLTSVLPEHRNLLNTVTEVAKTNFNDREELRKAWGGGVLSARSQAREAKKERIRQKELIHKS